MRIAFIGKDTGNAQLLRLTLERLGHAVVHLDPYGLLSNRFLTWWSHHTGNVLLASRIRQYLRETLPSGPYDLAVVDGGALLDADAVRWLKTVASRTLLFCRDNPFTSRDGLRWRLLKPALPHYDLFVTRRESSAEAAKQLGVGHVEIIIPPADEIQHQPLKLNDEDRARFSSQVAFVGTWMPERGPFIESLIRLGVPIRVFGARWDRASNYEAIRSVVTLGGLSMTDYAKAVTATDIALALLSKGNLDLHTARSLEIPALGKLLCAERTSDHLMMFNENEEAVFWEDVEECAQVCLDLLADPARIERIAAAGRARLIKDGRYNEPTWKALLDKAMALPRQAD
jgi:hypothetical protein